MHIITFVTKWVNGRRANKVKQEGNMVGLQATKGAPHTIPSPKHFTTGLFNQAGSFTQVWQKQADKLNWSEALNGMPNCSGRESAAMKCNGNGSGS